MGWYFLLAVLVLYALVTTYMVVNLLDDYALAQEKEERYCQRIARADEKIEEKNEVCERLQKELATAKRELEIVSNQYDDVQERRTELAKALDATREELMHANNLAVQRGDQLDQCQELLNERLLYNQKLIHSLSQIREICNT
jgi:peptidoglycan hydrolase CwlO-like protein